MIWMSLDSLQLWQSILSTASLQNLLIVAAFREDELSLDNPILKLAGDEINQPIRITKLRLDNLDHSLTEKILAAALASDPDKIDKLADPVCRRMEGKPYFSKELLKSLYHERLLTFDLVAQKWCWDRKEIEKAHTACFGTGDGVVGLLVNKMLHYRDGFSG
jgi:predicted ATPase